MANSGILTLSEAAAARVRELMAANEAGARGLRVGVREAGCSGFMYEIEYAGEESPMAERIEQDGAIVYIDPKALIHLFGAEMDYRADRFQSGFTFNNPNAIDHCGCGESFRVMPDAVSAAPKADPA